MASMDLASFDQAWDRLESWLAAHAPADHAALRPPATATEIAAVEEQLGFALHPQLRRLLERRNGVAEPEQDGGPVPGVFPAGGILPLRHRLLSTAEIPSTHQLLVEVHENHVDPDLTDEEEVAGHLHQCVPFALPNDGGVAFIDHQPGPTYGHAFEMGIGSGDLDGTLWGPSLTEFVGAVTGALETGTPFLSYWPTTFEHSSGRTCIGWEIRL
ncbi:cell wall assembly protein Knr4 [Streptomyces sp. NRRL F-5755]|uniref:SMI1/KNR4 family protein n=1 Tax=Streptomyces sp. NRRL F-5755 TaxID=1519475 RepID=UPI0006AF57E0|nr:SMI1/KNR4 family protein [Streptomyces sp. NRRL F-5755]KOT87418.1 cell wall assembly protein Knr4 [Streptomyces sp. NRRL F-5755]